MEDGAQLVVLEREEHEIPWGFSVVPCPDGVARITQVEPDSLAEEFGLCDGDRVLQVGRMKVDPRDGLNLNNINMLLRMPTPQLEIVVLRDDFLDRNLGPSIPKRRLQDFHPLPRNQSEDNESADEDEEEIVPSVPVKALSEYWEHPDQEGFEPTRPKPGFLPPEKTEVGEWHQREAARRQEKYEQERRQNEELERQRLAEEKNKRMSEPENVRTVEETLPDGTKIIRRIITKKAGAAPVAIPDGDREVQEFEDTLADGTKVIRRVIRTKRPAQQQVQQQQNDENVSIRQVEETLPDGTKVLRTYRTVKKQVQQENSEQGTGDQQRQIVQLNEQQLRQIQESTRQQPGGQETTVQRIQHTQQMQRTEHIQQTQQVQQQRTEHIQQIERREVRQVTQEVQEHHQQRQIEEHTRIVQQQEHQQQFSQIQQQETTQQKKPQPAKNRSPPPRSRSPPPRPLQSAPEPQRPKPKSRSPPPRPLNQAPEPRQPQPKPQPQPQQQQQTPRPADPPTPQAPPRKPQQEAQPQQQAPPQQPAMQKPPPTPKTQRKVDRNWEEQQRREFEEYLRQREEQGPPPQGPKSNADYVSKYQEQLLKRRPSQGGHQPGSIEDYRKQYEESLRRGSGPVAPPPPGANTEYIRMYEETLKKKEEIDRQRAEGRFERGQARTQEEYKRFYEEELRRKQMLEMEQEEERRRYLEEQSKQREHISRSKELYTQQLQKDMQKKEHLITRPTELRPERVGSQASHWEKIADNERAKMSGPQVPPSPKIQRKNLDACWPPKREDGVLVRPAFSRENSFHGSSRKVYQWPPLRASSVDRERPSTPMGDLKHDIRWNQQELERERMTTPPPFARSPQIGRRKVVWPPPSPTTEQTPFFEPGQRRGSQTASLEEYLANQQSPVHIPATYRPPPGTSHYEDQSF